LTSEGTVPLNELFASQLRIVRGIRCDCARYSCVRIGVLKIGIVPLSVLA
jgi:hypothetical protein